MTGQTRTKELCEKGLVAVQKFLERRGYKILETKWECDAGLIDFIAKDKNNLCFIALQLRDSNFVGFPTKELDRDQLEKIAQSYLKKKSELEECRVRFDSICLVVIRNDRALIRHHINCLSGEGYSYRIDGIDANRIKNVISFLRENEQYEDYWKPEIEELHKILEIIR